MRRDVIRDETTQTQDNESQSHRDSDSNFTFSFAADQSQGMIENTKRGKYVPEFLMFAVVFQTATTKLSSRGFSTTNAATCVT